MTQPDEKTAQPKAAGKTVWVVTTHPWTEVQHADLPPIVHAGTEIPANQLSGLLEAAARANTGVQVVDGPVRPETVTLAVPEGIVLADNKGGTAFPAVTASGTAMESAQAEAAHAEAARVGVVLTEKGN